MTKRKRVKIQDYLEYPDMSDVQLVNPSGFCITDDHDKCKYKFKHGKCGCSCHTTKGKQ